MEFLARVCEAGRNAYYSGLGKRLRYLRWKLFHRWGHLGKKVRFCGGGQTIWMQWTIHIGDEVTVHSGVVMQGGGRMEIGDRAYIGPYCVLLCSEAITIGPDTMLAPHVVIADADHGMDVPCEPMRAQPQITAPITIGSDCWIGANATIVKGVTIGDGAIIGAGAVVTREIPPGAVAAGVPARILRYRQGFGPTEASQQA